MDDKGEIITAHIRNAFPELFNLLPDEFTLTPISKSRKSVLYSIEKSIIGQMLSRRSATAIYHRADKSRKSRRLEYISELSVQELRDCGISSKKVKAMKLFHQKYSNQSSNIEAWKKLNYEDFQKQICACWGLGSWTAQMISIFHIGNEDLFPSDDGAIKRGVELLRENNINIDSQKARPYRTYLAIIIWHILDSKRL